MKTRERDIHILTILLGIFLLFWSTVQNQFGEQFDPGAYYDANFSYEKGDYQTAFRLFEKVLSQQPQLSRVDPIFKFKRAFAALKAGEYQAIGNDFAELEARLPLLKDYLWFFHSQQLFQQGDSVEAWRLLTRIETEYPRSPVNHLIDSLRAFHYLNRGQSDSALIYLERMLASKKFERTALLLKKMQLSLQRGDTAAFRKQALRFLNTYPFHESSERLYRRLLQGYSGKIPLAPFKKMVYYLFASRQFLGARKLIDRQKSFPLSAYEKEYLEWLLQEIRYRQGEYRRVLNWCLQNRTKFRTHKVRREIDLHIARCYARLGYTGKSIRAYLAFQKKYPSDRLGAEVLWKVAWLYEDAGEMGKALNVYRTLIKKYPRSNLATEARFRVGLNYYRQNKFAQARKSWLSAVNRTQSTQQKARLWYWVGKTFEKEQQYDRQAEIYLDLARYPVDSYYNMKAYYLTFDGKEPHRKIQEHFWTLHGETQSYLSDYAGKFRRVFFLKELLPLRWIRWELESTTSVTQNWKERFALGELLEKFGNYGKAFRIFRSIYNSRFSDAPLENMLPIFKKLYPFYYTAYLDSVNRSWGIEPELILSVIKKESAFDPRAISYANAYGLMQLIPGTASQVAGRLRIPFTSARQLFDPEFNIRLGSYYLKSLLERYQGNLVYALAAYNAGPRRVDRWRKTFPTQDGDLFMENIAFEQTRGYVRSVLKYYWTYLTITHPDSIPGSVFDLRRPMVGKHSTREHLVRANEVELD